MNEYRCTRRTPYGPKTPGFKNLSARQGYYIRAETEQEALTRMREKFPNDALEFDAQLWKENIA